MITPFF